MTVLRASLARLEDWYVNSALPLWSERSYDHARGGFFETLDFSGKPITGQPRRVRVQARQIYTFTQVAFHGWSPDGEALAAKGFDHFLKKACPDNGRRGCVHLISDEGEIIDSRRDLYDQAFLLLAAAARAKAGDLRANDLADNVIRFLDAELASSHGGWLESDAKELPRRQNPHMHLFEAFITLYEATEDEKYRQRAEKLYQLFLMRFYDPDRGVVREFFDDDWIQSPGKQGDVIEPGHMMEWVWLLDRYKRISNQNAAAVMETLYKHAREIGADEEGFLVDSLALGHNETSKARRLWPQTEYIKAALVMARRGYGGAEEHAARMIASLFDTYLNQPVAGLWCDRFLISGKPSAKDVPASILYHLFEAVIEASDTVNAMGAQ